MRVVVTGGLGYVGQATVYALLDAGHKVMVLDNLSTSPAAATTHLPQEVVLDFPCLNAEHDVTESLDSFAPEVVIHLAGLSQVGESSRLPLEYHRQNVVGTISLLRACRLTRSVRRLVFASSAAVYRGRDTSALREDSELGPVSVYGRTKLSAEVAIRDATSVGNFDAVILRYFNVCGADDHDPPRHWERHDPETHLVPLALTASGDEPLRVYGDGTDVRDYVDVLDVAAANVAAMTGRAGTYNVGSGVGHSVLDVLRVCRQVQQRDVPWVPAPERTGDCPRLVADISAAAKGLGWQPSRTLLMSVSSAWCAIALARVRRRGPC